MAKKQSFGKRILLVTLLLCGIAVLAFFYRNHLIRYGYKAWRLEKRLFNKETGSATKISFPKGYTVHGIDVSRWQTDVDFSKLKAADLNGDTINFSFAFIKATEGILLEDPTFIDNWESAQKNNIIRGAYHYFLPNSDVSLQAKNFISSVKLKSGDLPPVIDVEEKGRLTKKELVKKLKLFIAVIEKQYKVKPILYSNISFIEDYLADDFPDYNFWIAHYYEDELKIEKSVKWLFWQHSDRVSIPGSSSSYDANVFNGSKKDLKKLLIK